MSQHGHHKVAAAVFVGALILGCSIILGAELIKPARYQYHSLPAQNSYVIFDADTGRATVTAVDSKTPLEKLEH
jgi:hypothetical protein